MELTSCCIISPTRAFLSLSASSAGFSAAGRSVRSNSLEQGDEGRHFLGKSVRVRDGFRGAVMQGLVVTCENIERANQIGTNDGNDEAGQDRDRAQSKHQLPPRARTHRGP